MPIYEYTCQNCGREFEELIRGAEQPVCPACGQSRVERQLSVSAAHTAGPANSACPARDSCGMSHRCGQNCGHGQ
jgi:putative FmdB family regulatory protein